MERISGPIDGLYVVSYACEMGEMGDEFVGYTKLCSVRPDSFWQAPGDITYGNRCFHSAVQAMENSEAIALRDHHPVA